MSNVIRKSAMVPRAASTLFESGSGASMSSSSMRRRQIRDIKLVPRDPTTEQTPVDCEALEAAALQFDPADDLEALVPMPPSIPKPVQMALTETFAKRFEFYEDLDGWLHAVHPALDGKTPFESLVAGQGHLILAALLAVATASGPTPDVPDSHPALRLVR